MRYLIIFTLIVAISSLYAQTVDSVAIKQVYSLIKVSRELTGKKDFDKALEVSAAAENVALEKLGRESAAYGSCAFNRGRVNDFKKDYPEAEKWYLESKVIQEKVLGKEHPDYATCLNNLASLYSNIGNNKKAEPLYLEAKTIWEKALGKEHPDYALSLYNLGLHYLKMGNYEKSELLYLEVKDIWAKMLGKEHSNYAQTLNNLGYIYKNIGKYDKAETNYLEAIAIKEKMLGKEHLNYAVSLNNLALFYRDIGKYDKAETLYFEIIAIKEKMLGKEHPEYVSSINNLAIIYYMTRNYEKAEPLYLEAIATYEKALGKEHPEYAATLYNLAILYMDMIKYEKAEPLYLEAKTIRGKALGKEHPDYAFSLNNLAGLYWNMGRYEKVEPLFLEAKAIHEKVEGKESANYARTLHNLALIYEDMGNYEKAEPMALEARDIREKVLGKEHPDYAKSLNNLSLLYWRMGNYEKAVSLSLEAKIIREKIIGKESPDYAATLNNLAILYYVMGNYEKAEELNLEAKTIKEKVLGKEHPEYTSVLINLAVIYEAMGNYEKAEPLYLEAKAIREKALGKEHPYYAQSLHNLAVLHMNMGNYEKAEPLYLEAKAIREKVQGKEHPDYSSDMAKLAELYERQSRFSLSSPLLAEIYALDQARLLKAITFLSERELASYTSTFQSKGDNLGAYILARRTPRANGTEVGQPGILPALEYSNALFYKGFLLTAATQLNALVEGSRESEEISLRLKSYLRRLSAEYAKPIAERQNVVELEEKANTTEKELVRSRLGYAEAKRQVKWEDVLSTLKSDAAAIEFVSFKVNFPSKTDSVMYAALVLKLGAKQPKFIPLFEEKSLDSLFYYKSDRKSDYANSLYTLADRGAIAIEAPKKSLHDLIWKPLEKELTGIKTVYYAPSGLLHRINLDAIPISDTETLADMYQLVAVNSTRQLVIPDQVKVVNNEAVLYGGILYEQDSILEVKEASFATRTRGTLTFSSVDSTLRGGAWNYLAGTEREVNAIEKTMQSAGVKTNLKKGYLATEESFKNIGVNNTPSPRILHIATHGYFFPDPKSTSKVTNLSDQNEPVFKMSDHPMLRSGLIMAGGNAAWKGKQTLEGREDGILTAYEISQMNLSNTELVVLSACETGLGDIQGNEGVYGLQRAFKIAGAKYLIMSLWQVPDKQTSLLMTTFYKKWLEDKMSIPDAFHAAQKELREAGLDPYQWAGFVLVE